MSNNKKPSTASKIIYVVLVVLILMMFWPSSRALLQRGLMKIGLYKPKVEQPTTSAATQDYVDLPKPAVESALFVGEKSEQINTADLKGKVVFINFWATWCGPCIAEMPSIQTLHDHFKDNDQVDFMLIEIEGDMGAAQQFMQQHNLSMPVYVPGGNIPREWLSGAIPSTIVLDKDGQRAFSHKGMADYSDAKFIAFIQEMADK